jgi:antitoxin component YwqK of YwqJK toxin-antitoxin module
VTVAVRQKRSRHIEYHRDGSVRAKGWTLNGKLDGYWEWFRLDGTRLRSGSFDLDRQVGDWTTYDRSGAAYKVTQMPTSGSPPRRRRKEATLKKSR